MIGEVSASNRIIEYPLPRVECAMYIYLCNYGSQRARMRART